MKNFTFSALFYNYIGNILNLRLLALCLLLLVNESVLGQGVFGGKVAVMDAGSTTIWYNMNSESCDGAGTGNLSAASGITTLNAYLGDKYFMGGNVLTWGFGSSGNGAFLQWRVYTVGGSAPAWGSALDIPYNSAGVCSNGSNKKFEKVPVLNENSFQCTSTGSLRLDVLLKGYQSGTNYDVYTSGNYIPITVTALTAPTVGTVAPTASSATSIDLNWTRWNSKNVIILRKTSAITTAPTNGTAYSVGATIDGATVIYNGSGTSTADASLTAGTRYYYAFYSVNNDYYSAAATASATAGRYFSKSAQTDPNSTSNWTANADGTGANPSGFTGDNITFVIQSGHSYTTTAAWNITGASTLQVDGTLTLSHALALGQGVGVGDKIGNLTVNGILNANAQHSIANTGGTFTINSGGLYKLNHSTGSNSTTTFNGNETFNSGSTFEYANYSGATISNINYHHLVFSGASFTFPTNITIGGNMSVSAGSVTVNQTRTISGNLTLSGGTLTISSNNPYTLTVNGNLTISGGTLDMSSSGYSSDHGTLSIKGNFTHTAGTITETGSSTASTIAINGTTAQTIESTGRSNTVLFSVAQTTATGTCSVAAGKTFVNSGSTFTVTDNASTSSDFTINGTFKRAGAGTTTVTFAGTTVANGGTYEHATTGGSVIPTATWADGSLLLVSNAPDLSGMTQSFWNLTYDNANAAIESINDNTFAVRNILSMPSTNTGTIVLTDISNRTNSIATLNLAGGTFTMTAANATHGLTGNVNVSGGTFNMIARTLEGTAGAATITGNVTVSGGAFYAVASTTNNDVTSTIAGNLSVSGGTFYVTGNNNGDVHILDLNGTLDLSSTGVIEFNPVSAGTAASRLYVSGNVTVSGGTMQRTQTSSTGSTGIYFDGTTQIFTWSGGTISTAANAIGRRFYVNGVTTLNEVYSHGSAAQTTVNGSEGTPGVGSAWPTTINNLTINNTNGVTLSAAKTVGGTLTFTNGILTPNGNTLIISNTSTSAISGAGAGKYVSGPLKWNLSNSNGTYLFPVGKGGNFYPFSLTTTAASSPVITVESFNSDAGGTNGATITSPSTSEYWSATLNSGTFTGSLSLTRPTSLTSDVIAQSSSQTGTYSSIGGTLSSPSVNNSNSISSLGFFKFATSAACTDPTTQASGLSFTSVGATSMNVNWSGSGNGDGVIVVMKAGSAPTDPSDNIAYTANTAFSSGTDVGSSSFVVFNGSGSSVTVTGLSASTTYHVRVYSRSCTGSSIKINTTSPLSGSQITLAPELAAHPGSFTSSASLGGQIDLTYSAANTITNAAGYIILQKTGASAPASAPTDATAYAIGSTIGDGTVADIVTDVAETTSAITGLSSSTQYSYSIIPFSFDGSNSGTYNYYTAATIKTTTVTTIAAVTRYAVANGNWNSISTWSTTSGGSSGASVPTGSDVVYLQGNYTVTVTANASCGTINFDDVGTLTVNSGVTLSGGAINLVHGDKTVSGTIAGAGTLTCTTVNVGTTSPFSSSTRTTTLTSSISTLTASGATTLTVKDYAGAKNNSTFNIQSGTFTTTSITTIIPSAGGTATLNLASGVQTGTVILTGLTPFTIDIDGTSTITLNGSGATVNYAASGAQTVRNTSYTNLALSGSGNKTLAAFSINGTLSIEGSAVGITTAPNFGASSTLQYKNVGTRTTNAIEWPSSNGPANLIIDNSGSTVTMVSSANRTLSGNLTLTAGTLADNGNTLTLQGNIVGTATHSGAGSITMTGASKTISGATLGNLILNNASGFSLTGSPTINGALTFTSGKLGIGANTLNLAGTVASMTSTNNLTGSSSSTISITGTGTLGTLMFDQTTNGTTNLLSTLTINRSSTGVVNLGSALNLAGNLTVTNGSLRSSGENTLTMAGSTQTITISNSSGGSITGTDVGSGNNLTLAIANGSTTTFTGDATSSGDEDKKLFNVSVNSGGTLILQLGILCKYGTFTVNGTLQINSGGYIQSTNGIAPTYGASSSLIYNSGGTYGRGLEWSSTSNPGYPTNVTINSGSGLDLGNGGTGTMRQISGNLVINGGLYMDFGSNDMTQSLRVLGDLTIASTGQLSLSESGGGDIYVSGNWTRASGGIFNTNGRAVFFTGSGNSTITGSGGETFAYLIHQKSGGTLQLASSISITAPDENSNALTHNSSVDFNLNGNNITLSSASACRILADGGTRNFSGSGTINISGGLKTITTANSGTLSFGSTITVALTGGVNFGSSLTTINGTLKIDANGFVSTNPPSYGSGSTLHYNTGNTYGRSSEWSNNSNSGSGVPHHVLIGAGSSLIYGANSNTASNITSYINGNLTNNGTFFHSNGTTDAQGVLNIAGDVTSTGTIQIGSGTFDCNGNFNATGGNVTFSGNGILELSGSATSFGTFNRGSGTPTIRYNGGNQTVLALDASSSASYPNLEIAGTGTKTLAGTSSVYGNLVLTSGSFDLNAKTIYPKVHITRTSGDIVASSFSDITIDNSGSHNLCGVNSTNITINTTSTGGTVTTTGDITCRSIDLTSGSKTFTIDGETVNVGTNIVVTSGTLNITSGIVNINSNSNTSCIVNGGTLDIDGGSLTVGNNTLADLSFSSGTIDISGGTLNIVDQFEITGGTLNQSGGTLNIKSYVGNSDGSSTENKFDITSGTVNLTGGTLNLNGQVNNSSYYAMSVAAGVTLNATTGHTTVIQSNNSTSNDEDIYLNLNGKSLGNVTVNLVNHDLFLNSDLSVKGTLTLTDGLVRLGSNNLTIGVNGSSDGVITGSSASYVVATVSGETSGKLIRAITNVNGLYEFPIGDLSTYAPVRVDLNGGTTSLTNASIYAYTKPSKVTGMASTVQTVLNRSWVVEPTGITTPNYDIRYTYGAGEVSGDLGQELVPVKFSVDTWYKPVNSVIPNGESLGTATDVNDLPANTLEWTGLTSFSEFGGAGGSSPLPVELTSFSASCEEDIVTLSWSTASEQNSSHFDIEKSTDGENWRVIGSVLASGNSTQDIDYTFVDDEKSNGQNYYRLNQVDIDGKNEYFGPIQTNCVEKFQFTTFPNPSDASFQVTLTSKELVGMCSLVISDATGKVIEQRTIDVKEGINLFVINQEFTPGIYFLHITNGAKSTQILRHAVK